MSQDQTELSPVLKEPDRCRPWNYPTPLTRPSSCLCLTLVEQLYVETHAEKTSNSWYPDQLTPA